MSATRFLFIVATVAGVGLGELRAAEPAPETPKKPFSRKYQGVTVEDPYQWLEEDNDPQVKSWSDAQNQRTRQYLDKLPNRAAIEKQLTEWYAKTSPSYSSLVSRPGILFAMKFQPPKQQPLLVTLASATNLVCAAQSDLGLLVNTSTGCRILKKSLIASRGLSMDQCASVRNT
jgi:prolyl oligopeptidase family protein